jgi:type II secretory pathway predicted ATPase ExeA
MGHLYQDHFGLTQEPFNITPDPAFLYLSASHREALAQLSYGINARKGFVVLTGEVGTGKTTMIQALLNDLNATTEIALIFGTITSPLDLLRYVCEEFRLVDPKQPQHQMHDYLVLLNEFLLEKYRRKNNCALIIDEAQNLTVSVLESIRLLSNFETPKDKLLQIVLVGQPELAARLNTPEMRQLKQRVTLRHHLRPLSSDECQDYISNRIRFAGGNSTIFSADALERIFAYAGGVPRLVNVLCDNAMLTGYALGTKQIDCAIIEEVAADLCLTRASLPTARPTIVDRANGFQKLSTENGDQDQTPAPQKSVPRTAMSGDASPLASSGMIVARKVLDTVKSSLIEAMGPMAELVLRERIRLLGVSADAFPQEKLSELIEDVSQEILDETMRRQFYQLMRAHRQSYSGPSQGKGPKPER